MIIMVNPSTGGGARDDNDELKADPTINQILNFVDNGTFDNVEGNDVVTGVHIRNLFYLRTSSPAVLKQTFEAKLNELIEQNNQTYDPEFEKNTLEHVGLSWDLNEGEVPREWVETSKNCKYVIVAWGNCCGAAFKGVKEEVRKIECGIVAIVPQNH